MGRPPCCDKSNVKKGPWTPEEDAKVLAYVANHGIGNWTLVPEKAGLNRCGKSCRLRWTNYLRPDLKHDAFTPQEENHILVLHQAVVPLPLHSSLLLNLFMSLFDIPEPHHGQLKPTKKFRSSQALWYLKFAEKRMNKIYVLDFLLVRNFSEGVFKILRLDLRLAKALAEESAIKCS
ncbi:hypothetical protein POM88_021464 [Heracleum sosnowskyi]|uniref:Uncharacterized protein n=1 Tax=Heracleum sosnowskyi TaxID=360622 RepID=A0AAD8IEW1_9APIA|nr:hypothetical protein POM88_021464 [Heracleum sosnowskyi]